MFKNALGQGTLKKLVIAFITLFLKCSATGHSAIILKKRIAKLQKKNNWWGPAGETGPCGGDTEMFYWTHSTSSGQAGEEVPESFNDDNSKWLEIWNDVFMQYNKTTEGKFALLTQQNVD